MIPTLALKNVRRDDSDDDGQADVTARSDDDFKLKDSVTTQPTQFSKESKLLKESESRFSLSQAGSNLNNVARHRSGAKSISVVSKSPTRASPMQSSRTGTAS